MAQIVKHRHHRETGAVRPSHVGPQPLKAGPISHPGESGHMHFASNYLPLAAPIRCFCIACIISRRCSWRMALYSTC